MSDPGLKSDAIEQHSRQAADFAERYARLSEPYRSCFAYSRRRLAAKMDSFLPRAIRGMRVLDVGCGTGHQLSTLRQRGFEVIGVDASAEMVRMARRMSPTAAIALGDVEALPFDAAKFDIVICIEVLRYLPELRTALLEMARVLRPGGVCLVTAIPPLNLNGYWAVNRVVKRFHLPGFVHLQQFFHSPARLRREFEAIGFQNVGVHGVYIGPINWIERVIPFFLPTALRAWEALDAVCADRSLLRTFSNMVLVRAVKSEGIR